MSVSPESILAHCQRLRRAQAETFTSLSQDEVALILSAWAMYWREPSSPWRDEAALLAGPFPYAMTRVSLDALVNSLSWRSLMRLIGAERVRNRTGYPLIGHVIAGNTPLLAWTSLLRALLMRSASYVKLPSNDAAQWAYLFHRTLAVVSPNLASAIHLDQWTGGTTELDAALCGSVDCVLAHGSEGAIDALRVLCPPGSALIGYGHRVSFGLCSAEAATPDTAQGFARDILLYDQGGCLSAQVIYVRGDYAETVAFAERLAQALPIVDAAYPLRSRTNSAAQTIHEARLLARMETDTLIWEDAALRWTVIARPTSAFTISPTHGVVSVQPLAAWDDLPAALLPVAGHLQGCSLAVADATLDADIAARLAALGVSRICAPGALQAPPLAWRQDGKDVLRSLLPGRREKRLRV